MSEYVTIWVDDLPDLKRGERIIRCADCVHAHDKTDSGYWCSIVESRVQPDDFCSWGKRGTWRLEDEY